MEIIMKSIVIGAILVLIRAVGLYAIEPVDPDLIPEGRRVLSYLDSIYGKKCLLAVENSGSAEEDVYKKTGRKPSIAAGEIWGFTKPHWEGNIFKKNLRRSVDHFIRCWKEGAIPVVRHHWGDPTDESAGFKSKEIDMAKAVTPGTAEYDSVWADIVRFGDVLEELADSSIPVLYRPLHEITGGWFWWNDADNPENTVKLWKMLFDYFVHERGIHNLIWVWSAGENGPDKPDAVSMRRSYYPGDEYVDIAGIDVYGSERDVPIYGAPKFHEVIKQVAPNKMVALSEAASIPEPDTILAHNGPFWLYSLNWYDMGVEKAQRVYNHDYYITRDELPDFTDENNCPFVRILSPQPGFGTLDAELTIEATASDKEGDVRQVEFFADGESIGVDNEAPWTFTWSGMDPGIYVITAEATDEGGLTLLSSPSRISVGLQNLAKGRPISTPWEYYISDAGPGAVVDGDIYTSTAMRANDTLEGADNIILTVDLEEPAEISRILTLWSGTNAEWFSVWISKDSVAWDSVGGRKGGWGLNNKWHEIDSIDTRAQYVQLRIVPAKISYRNTPLRMSVLNEIEIYGTGGTSVRHVTGPARSRKAPTIGRAVPFGTLGSLERLKGSNISLYTIRGRLLFSGKLDSPAKANRVRRLLEDGASVSVFRTEPSASETR